MLKMDDWYGQHTHLHPHSTAHLVQIARAPTALTTGDLPGVAQFAPLIEQPSRV